MRAGIFAALVFGCASACTGGRGQVEAPQPEQPTGLIRGIVVNEKGQPVDGAQVSAGLVGVPDGRGRRFVGSGPRGRFALDRLAWGEYAVCARKEADSYPSQCWNFYDDGRIFKATLSLGAPVADVVVVVGPKAGVLSGSVKDATTGAPVPASLQILRRNSPMPFIVSQSVPPQFSVLIPPESDLDIEVRAPGYRVWRYSLDGGSRGAPLRARSEERRTLDVSLWPEPGREGANDPH